MPGYSEATLQVLEESRLNWICRVPGTLSAVKDLQQLIAPEAHKVLADKRYASACYPFDYGGVHQHWVVYHSEQAGTREAKTMKRRVNTEAEEARKRLKKLSRKAVNCQEDAQEVGRLWSAQWKWHTLEDVQVLDEAKHKRPGALKREAR